MMEMLMSRGRARRSLTNHCPRQNRLDLREINLLPIKIELDGVKKKKKKKHKSKQHTKLKYLFPTLFPPSAQLPSFIPNTSTSSPLSGSQGEMEGCDQPITAPQTLTCCSMGSSHELAVLQENLPGLGSFMDHSVDI